MGEDPARTALHLSHARFRVIAEVSQALATVVADYPALLERIVRTTADLIGDGCAVMLLDADQAALSASASAHREAALHEAYKMFMAGLHVRVGAERSLAANVVRTGVPVLISEVDPAALSTQLQEPIRPVVQTLNIQSLVVVPLRANHSTLGVMAMVRSEAGRSYTQDDVVLLQEIAGRAGFAIENARLYEEASARAAELRATNEELRRYATLVEGLSDAVISTDAEQRIRTWSRGAEKLYGWSADEVIGQLASEVVKSAVGEVPRTQVLRKLAADGHWSGERVQQRRDGTWLRALISAAALKDQTGRVIGMLSISRDVTKQRKYEEDARLLAALVESSSDAIVGFTPEGIIQTWNTGAQRILGFAPQEVVGTNVSRLTPRERRADVAPLMARLLRGERVESFETASAHKDGSLVELSVSLSPIVDGSGNIVGISSIGRDIRERRRLERQVMVGQRMASVGMLAAGVAHEINNPLAYVVANLDDALATVDALREPSSAEARPDLAELLSEARDGALRIARIVSSLKSFSRTDRERRDPLSLEDVIQRAVSLANNKLKHRARLIRNYTSAPMVLGDEGRLVQVFINLLVNAAQALPASAQPHSEIRVSTSTDARGRAVVEIRDTGTGIPEEIRGRLFEPFVTTKGTGTGLGLSICQEIVSSHGGEISYETALGVGTTFRIALPAAPLPAPAMAPAPERAVPPGARVSPPNRTGKVMVVDDEPQIRRVLSRLLGAEHEVVACSSAQEALDLIATGERFDVILCDLMMPEMTGIDAYEHIKKVVPDQSDRMIFMTGGAFTPEGEAFLERFGHARIDKPFDPSKVRDIVRARVAG